MSGSRASSSGDGSRAKCTIELEEHRSTVVLGEPALSALRHEQGFATADYGVSAVELGGRRGPRRRRAGRRPTSSSGCGSSRGTPRLGRELDDRVMPGRGGARGAGRSASRRAATPGRSRSRGSTTGAEPTATFACSRSKGASGPPPTPSSSSTARSWDASRVPPRDPERRPRRARLCPARGAPRDAELALGAGPRSSAGLGRGRLLRLRYTSRGSRARSSGNPALPCGGRGRTFERAGRSAPQGSALSPELRARGTGSATGEPAEGGPGLAQLADAAGAPSAELRVPGHPRRT